MIILPIMYPLSIPVIMQVIDRAVSTAVTGIHSLPLLWVVGAAVVFRHTS